MKSASLLFGMVSATSESPRFEDFSVIEEKIPRSVVPRLNDAAGRQYATELREGARHKPNFAGHFILISWGCGASCVMSAVVNAKNGAVIWVPFTICCWDADIEPLVFRLKSRLLEVNGYKNEIESSRSFYEFDGERFNLVKENGIGK
jgi:hypothetical protein